MRSGGFFWGESFFYFIFVDLIGAIDFGLVVKITSTDVLFVSIKNVFPTPPPLNKNNSPKLNKKYNLSLIYNQIPQLP